jgi:hypothetical protein
MAIVNNFVFPGGGQTTYVPTLHEDILVAYVRNPNKFPHVKYTGFRKVDKMRGYYVKFQNSDQARAINTPQQYFWQDAADAPQVQDGNDAYEFLQFSCKRYAYTKQIGYLGAEQAAWDLMGQATIFSVMKGMTNRSVRIASTLTTAANYPTANQGNASVLGGAVWSAATSTTPAIRKSVMAGAIQVEQATLGSVQFNNLYLVINPNTAKTVMASAEVIDFFKQNVLSLPIWEGQEQFLKYGIPENMFGIRWVVDDTVKVTDVPNLSLGTNTTAFVWPDNVAVLLSKFQDIESSVGANFSTFEIFGYQDFETYLYADAKNQRYDLQIVENVDDSFLLAPESGFLINTNA